MTFGNRLKMLRNEKQITQKELGSIINISERVIGYYESDDRFPKDDKVIIDKAYKVAEKEILNSAKKMGIEKQTLDNAKIILKPFLLGY